MTSETLAALMSRSLADVRRECQSVTSVRAFFGSRFAS
jgi:hypothetical protein